MSFMNRYQSQQPFCNNGGREQELTLREKTNFIHSQNSDFYPGNMNPLNTRVISKCLTIDTRFRDNYDSTQSSDFQFQLPLSLSKVVSMQLSSFEIPVSFYGISSSYGNNYLYMEITDTSDVKTQKIIVIPDGNYNAQDLVSAINNLLRPVNDAGVLTSPNDLFSYVQLTLDINENGSGSGKVTIATTSDALSTLKSITLDFTKDISGTGTISDISTRIGWNLGFTKPLYENLTTYTAETIIEPATIRYIYLAVDDFNKSSNDVFMTAFNQSLMSSSVIARISIKGTYFSLLMENDLSVVTEPRTYFGPVDIQRLRIRLYDDHGRILQMNGANFSFCLVFKMLYDL